MRTKQTSQTDRTSWKVIQTSLSEKYITFVSIYILNNWTILFNYLLNSTITVFVLLSIFFKFDNLIPKKKKKKVFPLGDLILHDLNMFPSIFHISSDLKKTEENKCDSDFVEVVFIYDSHKYSSGIFFLMHTKRFYGNALNDFFMFQPVHAFFFKWISAFSCIFSVK